MSYPGYRSVYFSRHRPSSDRDSKGQSGGGANKIAGGPVTVDKEKEQGAVSKLYPDLEEQGAVSKLYPDLEQAGVEEITSAPKELSKLPDAVEDLWKNLDFLVTNGKSSPKHFSCRLDIAKVQFALTGEPKLISIDVLKEKDINLTVSEECLEVTITNLDIDIDESMDYIEKIFKSHIINNFKSIKLEPNSPEQCSALLALSKKVPVLVKHKKVVIYKCTASNTLNIVGETLHFPVLMKELGLSSNVEETVTSSASQTQLEIDTNLEESLILGYTGFEGYLKEKYPKKCTEVDVSQKPPKLKITSVGFSIEDAKEEKNKFLTSSKRKKIMMNDQRCCELLFKDEIYPNESVYLFLQGKLSAKMKSKRSEPKFCITKSENGVYVNCRDNTESEMAKIIEENIISCQAKISSTKAFEALDRWARSEKLRYLEKSSGSVVLCCTSDIHNKVLDDISSDRAEETEIPVTFPSLVVKFLRSVGSDLLQDIEGKFGVQTSFDDLTLKLKGHPSKLEDCKRFLNTEIRKLRRSLPLQLPKECLESKRNDLDKALQKQGCCCQFHYKGRKMAKMLSNCEYLVSWIDPIRQLKITAVKGCPWHLDVDLQIVFTNHCLFPVEVEIVPTNAISKFIEGAKDLVEKNAKMYKVGEYTDVLADVKGMDTSGVVALVVSSDEGTGMNIKGISMRDKLQEIFMKRPVQRSKTVCFNAYLQPEIVDVVKNTIEATIQFAENGTRSQIEELFVCCMKGHKEVLQKIDKIFQLKRGYCREIHTNDANIWENKEPTLNVIVRLGSLHEVKADVLVNTTNKDLILTRGKVSQELLTLAGTSLLDQCKNKYPDGIRNGEIAVTDSHNLRERGFKFIYHAALLDYSYETFQQNIKLYVKLCLCQAERNECSRIAFPAFGVGKLRYPRRETAAAMFEAIDEFCEEALNPKLNKVKLVVHESDDKTCQAFANEEWRHSKACVKEIGETKQHIASDFRALELETKLLSIRIATQEDFGIPKSYAVEIFFGQGKRGLKQASEKPRTWNDQIGLDYIKDKSQMTDNVLWTLALLVEERVTEPVFYTNTDNATPLSEGEQVKAILDGLKTQTDTRFPKKVIIVVSDESGLHNVAQMLNIEEQLASDWTNNNSEGHRISFELIGKTKASLDGAETFVKDFVKKIKEESALEAVKRHSVKIKTEAVNASFEATDKDELEETYEVTAELNPGIVRFKKKSNDWDNWRVKVEEKFNVKIFCSEDAVKVGGMFHDILELENYLESSSALDDPIMSDGMFDSSGKSLVPMPLNEDHFGQIHHSPILVRMSETEYQAFMLLCKLEETTNEEKNIRICYDITAHGMLISTSRNIPTVKQQVERELQILKNNERHIQIQSETDLTLATQAIEKVQEEMKVFCCITSNNQDVMITGLHFDEVEKASCLISQSLQLPVPDQTGMFSYCYRISDLLIFVQKGDIAHTKADCIVVPSVIYIGGINSSSKGIVGQLASIKGSQFKEKCHESATKENKCLKENECRVIKNCSLPLTDQVMLVKIPYIYTVSQEKLKAFEDLLLKVVLTADEQNVYTLALPLLSSDERKGGLTKALSAQQYVRAFERLKEQRKNVRLITIVDKNEEVIETVKTVFGKHLEVVKSDWKLSELTYKYVPTSGYQAGE